MSVIIKGKNPRKPHTVRYWVDGGGTGSPGVPAGEPPVFPIASPDGSRDVLVARARSPMDLAGDNDANAILTGSNPLTSAGVAIVRDAASLLMYSVRFPGFG